LNILQITNMYPSTERPNWGVFVRSQVDSLARHGVHSEVTEIEGWRSKANYLRALIGLPSRVASGRYDLLHIHYGLSALAAVRVPDVPTVVSFCGDDFWGRPDRTGKRSAGSLWLARITKRVTRHADVVIVKSAEMASALGPEHEDVEVIPNGVDFALFDPMPRDAARRELGWRLDREILLFPANPEEPRKNFALAQEVESRLLRAGRPVELRSLYGRPQREVLLAMSAADLMLSCSLQEGSPNAVKEAMAVNLPVIATDVGDCAERLRGCVPGAVVARDPEAFTRASADVLALNQRSNGRQMLSGLDLDSTALRVLDVYRRAIRRFQARRRA
jgi:glycosyltransferase involved in cell wall biosynthesis